mgnify:FL=1
MAEKKMNLRELSEDELRAQYKTYKEELFNLRFQLATGQLENTARLKTVRRNIARVMTYLHQAEIGKGSEAGYLPPRKRRRKMRRELAVKEAAKVARKAAASAPKAKA